MGISFNGGTIKMIASGSYQIVPAPDYDQVDLLTLEPWPPRHGDFCVAATDVVVDDRGNAYVASRYSGGIFKVHSGGGLSMLAGCPYTERAGPPPRGQERPHAFRGLAVAASGEVLVTDAHNHRVYALSESDKSLRAIAGTRRGWIDGPPDRARLRSPGRIAVTNRGLIVEEGWPWLRKVSPEGAVATLPPCLSSEPNAWGQYPDVSGLASGPDGQVAVAFGDEHLIVVLNADGSTTTVRDPREAAATDEERDTLWEPGALAYSSDGALLFVDQTTWAIHRIPTNGGPAEALLTRRGPPVRVPRTPAMAVGPDGTVYLSDPVKRRIVALSRNHVLRPYITGVRNPGPLAVDQDGRLVFIADGRTIERLSPTGEREVLFESPPLPVLDGGSRVARFHEPERLALGTEGTLFVLERTARRIREVRADGTVRTIVRGGATWPGEVPRGADIVDIATGSTGELFAIDDLEGHVYRFVDGHAERVTRYEALDAERPIGSFLGLDVASDGTFIVGDGHRERIYRLKPNAGTELVAGSIRGTWDGEGPAARFSGIRGIARSESETILVADRHRLARIAADGTVSTIAGAPLGWTLEQRGYRCDLAADAVAAGPNGTIYALAERVLVLAPGEASAEKPTPDDLAMMLQAKRYVRPVEPYPTRQNSALGRFRRFLTRWEDMPGRQFTGFSVDEVDDLARLHLDDDWAQFEAPKLVVTMPLRADQEIPYAFEAGRSTSPRYDVLQHTIVAVHLTLDSERADAFKAVFKFEHAGDVTLHSNEPYTLVDIAVPDVDGPINNVGRLMTWSAWLGRTISNTTTGSDGLRVEGPGWHAVIQRADGSGQPAIPTVDIQSGTGDASSLTGRTIVAIRAIFTQRDGHERTKVELDLDDAQTLTFVAPSGEPCYVKHIPEPPPPTQPLVWVWVGRNSEP